MTYLIITIGIWLVAAAQVAAWLSRTWSPRLGRARTRAVLIKSGVGAVVVLAGVRALAPPPAAWSWLWLILSALVGVGLAGAIRRWSALPWRDPKRESKRDPDRDPKDVSKPAPRGGERAAIAGTAVYVAIGAGLLAVLA